MIHLGKDSERGKAVAICREKKERAEGEEEDHTGSLLL